MPHDESRLGANSVQDQSYLRSFAAEEDRLERIMEAIRQAEYSTESIDRAIRENADLASRIAADVAFEKRIRGSAPPLTPEKIGHYQIRGELAHGGMGRIYKGWDPDLYRYVAIKTVRQDLNAAEYKRRFLREQRILARLHETRIIPIFESGTFEYDGRTELYYVMPLIEGAVALGDVLACAKGAHLRGETPRLSDLVARAQSGMETTNTHHPMADESEVDIGAEGQAPAAERAKDRRLQSPVRHSPMYLRSAARVMSEVAVALDFGHAKGVIHRDCKPANILISPGEEVFVLDFGLASVVDASSGARGIPVPLLGESDLTQIFTEGMGGTPPYMAPEQFAGKVSFRTDVWSLGVTLYELLTFHRPFGSDRHHVRKRIETEPPQPVRDFAVKIPKDLEAICLKALQKDPARRYSSAAEFAADLRLWRDGFPTLARPARAPRRAWLWMRRNPGWAAMMFAVIAALLIVLRMDTIRAEEARDAAVAKQAAADKQRDESQRGTDMQKLQQIRLTAHRAGWSEAGTKLGKSAGKIRQDNQLRDQLAANLAGVDAVVRLDAQRGGVGAVFGADADQLLIVGAKAAEFWNTRLNTFEAPLQTGTGLVAYNSDKEGVAWTMEAPWSFVLWNVTQRRKISAIRAPFPALQVPPVDPDRVRLLQPRFSMAIAGDGTLFAASVPLPDQRGGWPAAHGATFVWNAKGELLRRFDGEASSLSFSPDRTLLAAGRENGGIDLLSLTDGNVAASLPRVENQIHALDFTVDPVRVDDKRRWLLAAGDSGGTITIWDVAARQPRARCLGSHYQVYTVKFSPDRMTLASGGRQAVRLWDYLTGEQMLELRAGDFYTDLAFSADGRQLAISAERGMGGPAPSVSVWSIENDRGISQFHGMSSQVVKTCLSADRRLLAALSQSGEIGIFDVEPPVLRHILHASAGFPGFTADNGALAVSPDKALFAVSFGNEARVFELEGGKELHRHRLPPALVDHLAFTPDGKLLSYRAECLDREAPPLNNAPPERFPRVLRIRNLLGDDPLKPLAQITRFNWHVFYGAVDPHGKVFVADGLHRAADGQSQEVIAFDGVSGEVLWSKRRPTSRPAPMVVIDPSGRTVAFSALDDEGTDFANLHTGESRGHTSRTLYALAKDGGYFVAATDGAGFALVQQGSEQSPVVVTLGIDIEKHQISPCFSLDGRYLSIGTMEGHILLCDLPEIERRLIGLGFPRWK